MIEQDELRRRLAEIEAREQAVAKREQACAAKSVRGNLYDRVTLSVSTLNFIILACALLIVALVAVGYCLPKSGKRAESPAPAPISADSETAAIGAGAILLVERSH